MVAGRRQRRCDSGGFAVAAVLLLLIGLTALAHGALVLAGREQAASTLEARLLSRRLLARAAARAFAWPDTLPTLRASPVGLGFGDRPPLHWSREGVRLDREMALLVGVGRVDRLAGTDRVAAVAVVLDPSARVAAARGVVEVGAGAELGGGTVSSADWFSPPSPQALWLCASELAALDSLGARAPAPVVVVPGRAAAASGPTIPDLGLLPGDTALGRIEVRLSPVVTPGPMVHLGACVDAESNWGSPSEPLGPCGTRMVLAAAEGDVAFEGGEGQGVVIAGGSVTFASGARFSGLVFAGGDLLLEGGAMLTGAARVGGTLRLRDGQIRGSACAAARALRAATALRQPYLPTRFGRIHPL